MIPIIRFLFSLYFICGISLFAHSAEITKANSKSAIVSVGDLKMSQGDEFFAINSEGKRTALLVVSKVTSKFALMQIKKGKIQVGQTVAPRKSATPAKANPESKVVAEEDDSDLPTRRNTFHGGVLFGYAMNTMSLTVQTGSSREDITMTDSSFSLKPFVDYHLSPSLTVRGATGYETFNVKGTLSNALCSGSTNCQAQYSYLPLEGSAQYNFMNQSTRAYVGLGYSFLIELNRSVNIPNLNSESKTNQMIMASIGADFALKNKKFIPVVFEYATFPGSTNVKASALYLRVGYGFW